MKVTVGLMKLKIIFEKNKFIDTFIIYVKYYFLILRPEKSTLRFFCSKSTSIMGNGTIFFTFT